MNTKTYEGTCARQRNSLVRDNYSYNVITYYLNKIERPTLINRLTATFYSLTELRLRWSKT